jgi:hypothetical protein
VSTCIHGYIYTWRKRKLDEKGRAAGDPGGVGMDGGSFSPFSAYYRKQRIVWVRLAGHAPSSVVEVLSG